MTRRADRGPRAILARELSGKDVTHSDTKEPAGPTPTGTGTGSGGEVSSPTLGKRRRHFGSHAPPPPLPAAQPLGGTASAPHEVGLAKNSNRKNRSLSSASGQTTLTTTTATTPSSSSSPKPHAPPRTSCPPWKWFGLPPAHKRLELGFLANAIQLFGAVAFEVSVICGMPGVLGASGATGGPAQSSAVQREWIAAYWASEFRDHRISSPAWSTNSSRGNLDRGRPLQCKSSVHRVSPSRDSSSRSRPRHGGTSRTWSASGGGCEWYPPAWARIPTFFNGGRVDPAPTDLSLNFPVDCFPGCNLQRSLERGGRIRVLVLWHLWVRHVYLSSAPVPPTRSCRWREALRRPIVSGVSLAKHATLRLADFSLFCAALPRLFLLAPFDSYSIWRQVSRHAASRVVDAPWAPETDN